MSPKIILRALALLLAAGSFSAVRLAAQDEPSVAEAARRARQQKQAAPKPARIIDNDSIPPSHNAPATPAADSAAAEANPSTPATPSDSNAPVKPEDTSASPSEKGTADADAAAAKKAKIEALKKQIADKKESVDLQHRAIALAQDTFYSNPDHQHDRDGKAKLDSMQADLEQEKAELAELQAKLAELGDSADSKPAAAPPQP
jgi:anti-sigma28 factor (negative regulator of flagellin synthesis)